MKMVKAVDSIAFICNPVHTYQGEGWSPHDDFLAGTEQSIREWSAIMASKGYQVSVYYNGQALEYMGVYYKPYSDYQPADIEINIKYLDFSHSSKSNVWYLTNETDIAQKKAEVDKFLGVILPSKWAMDNLGYEGNVKIVPHAYNEGLFRYRKDQDHKVLNQCIYTSSPDRGLSEVVRVWPEVVSAIPDATLIVTYNALPADIPNAMFIGHLTDEEMGVLYRESDFWLHPCLGGELFCMAAVQAQVALAIPIYYSTMALSETVRWGRKTNPRKLAQHIIQLMMDSKRKQTYRYKMQTEHYADWAESTQILLEAIGATKRSFL